MRARGFFALLRAELKRMAALGLPLLCAAALLLAGAGLIGHAVLSDRAGDDAMHRIELGVVGDLEHDPWLQLGFHALETLDSSRFSLHFRPIETEAEGLRLLRTGALDGCLVIPDGFLQALEYGYETEPVRYISAGGAVNAGTVMAEELAGAVARLLAQTEHTIYAAQDYLVEHRPETDPDAAGAALPEEYLALILDRDSLFRVEELGLDGGLSSGEYYLCALSLLLPLLWGVASAGIFGRKNEPLRRLLGASGLGAAAQVTAKYLVYLLPPMALEMLWMGLLLVLGRRFPAALTELGVGREALAGFPLRALVPVLSLSAVQLLLFELSAGPLAGLLLQFTTGMGMAYLSGCLYPSPFFPEGLRRLGAALPSGLAFAWMQSPGTLTCLGLTLYLAAALTLCMLLRSRALEGGVA